MGMTEQELAALAAATSQLGSGSSDYASVASLFGAQGLASQMRASLGLGGQTPGPLTPTAAQGWTRLPNGVLINAAQQSILFPTKADGLDPAEIEGSEEWLISIQDSWSDAKFDSWRKRLIKQGFDQAVGGIAPKGGFAADLKAGLRAYWQTAYLNGGKPIAFAPSTQTREAIRKQVDFVSLKEEMKTWGQVPFGEDLADSEAEWLADKLVGKMTELARAHPEWSFAQLQTGAETRVQREFTEDPNVTPLLKEAQDQEVSYNLRDSILSIAQLGGI